MLLGRGLAVGLPDEKLSKANGVLFLFGVDQVRGATWREGGGDREAQHRRRADGGWVTNNTLRQQPAIYTTIICHAQFSNWDVSNKSLVLLVGGQGLSFFFSYG